MPHPKAVIGALAAAREARAAPQGTQGMELEARPVSSL